MEYELRIGLGLDVHAFVENRPLILGGVQIPHDRGLAGHSDADVLTHALMDAILGAMRAGDIGQHFPDTDPSLAGVSSMLLLGRTCDLMHEAGWELVDADCVLALETPKIGPYRDRMRHEIAGKLQVQVEHVGLKATTTEGLGFAGRGEGVQAQAVVLLRRRSTQAGA